MARKDLAVLYGRVALIAVAFAFVIGIVAGPLLKAGLRPVVVATQEHGAGPELISVRSESGAARN